MQKNFKFHAIAIAIICVLVVVLYLAVGPRASGPTGAPTPKSGERQVRIYSASWGLNCNEEIDRLANDGPATYQRDDKGNVLPPKRYSKVAPDNVLERVSLLCNNHYSCEIRADSDLLGINPIDVCYKDLVVTYRCEAFEPPKTLTLNQGDTQIIDCQKPAHAPATAAE